MKRKEKNQRKPMSQKKKTKLIILISAIAVLIITMVLLVVFLPRSGSNKDNSLNPMASSSAMGDAQNRTEEPNEPIYAHGTAFSFSKTGEDGSKPVYTNPLTGIATEKDLTNQRPCAIMINNIRAAIPQEGISNADVLYECLAEGGITRLLMVTSDYSSLGVVGSVRSSREYYIDFAQNHDAIYIHAGGSEEAYSQIVKRGIDHIDGVNADGRTGKNLTGTVFYRDKARMAKMAYEHTLMTTGENIANGISIMNYRTEHNDDFKNPIRPIDWGWKVDYNGEDVTHISIPYRTTQTPEYEYDASSSTYLRYQFNHEKHIDNTNGEQLAFSNVVVLNVPHENRGDAKNHLNVYTAGNGEGYCFSAGKMIPIKWSKKTQDSVFELTDVDGYPLVLNRGKTMINIVDNTVYSNMSYS